jgi:hypothetical protein
MSILTDKYWDFPFNNEFPNLYFVLLYESGGDFETYSKIIGYDNYKNFKDDFIDFNEKYEHKTKL